MLMQPGFVGYYVGPILGVWAMWLVVVCLMVRLRGSSGASNAEIVVVQALLGVGSGVVIGCVGIGVRASVGAVDLPIAITLYGMVAYIGGVLGEGTSTTIWVNVLPSKLSGRMDPAVDINMAINNITYFFELPHGQRAIVCDGYVQTQKILTICGICSMLLAGIAVLGLAPYDLSVKKESGDKTGVDAAPRTRIQRLVEWFKN